MEKKCYKCKHYGQNVNQGMRWCFVGESHFDEDAENCLSFDEYDIDTAVDAYSTTADPIKSKFESTDTYKRVMGIPNPMNPIKISRAKKKRKKERGIKHGRRK